MPLHIRCWFTWMGTGGICRTNLVSHGIWMIQVFYLISRHAIKPTEQISYKSWVSMHQFHLLVGQSEWVHNAKRDRCPAYPIACSVLCEKTMNVRFSHDQTWPNCCANRFTGSKPWDQLQNFWAHANKCFKYENYAALHSVATKRTHNT